MGTVAMANAGKNKNASQFYITTKDNLDYLDEKHTIFGQVSEGLDILTKLNNVFVDEDNKPLRTIRILHTVILDDPTPDPPGLTVPDAYDAHIHYT
jgi:peptidyl-prolyl cis-trans isomerase-like 4